VPVTLSNLSALNAIAGFDLGTLFNAGDLTIPDSGSAVTQGTAIATAIIAAGVDPVESGIALFEALAGPAYNNLSPQTLVDLLLAYASQAGTGTSVPQDVGTAIAGMVPGSFTATQAVADIVQAANIVSATGQVLGAVLVPLQGVLGSDPIAAAVQLMGPSFSVDEQLGVAHAASVVAGLEALLGSSASSLTNSDLTLASPSAGTDIANAVFTALGPGGDNEVGAALIQALGQQNSVDPVPAQVYYSNQLAALIGYANFSDIQNSLPDNIGAAIQSSLVTSAAAATDIINATIALADAASTPANAILAGEVAGLLLEGVSSSALSNSIGSFTGAINGTTLSFANGAALLVGLSVAAARSSFSTQIDSAINTEISALISNSDITPPQFVNLLALGQATALTNTYMQSSGLTYAQIATDLTAAIPSQVSATQALRYLGAFITNASGFPSPPLADAALSVAIPLVNNGQVTFAQAYTQIAGTAALFYNLLAATSATVADAVSNFVDNNFWGGANNIVSALSNGSLSPANNSALPAGVAAASGATSAATTSTDTLTFASLPSGAGVGMLVVDTTASGAISAGTFVTSISGGTVTLSGNVTVGLGDTIAFYNQGIGLAIDLLAVTPTIELNALLGITTTGEDSIFTYINNNDIPIGTALTIIVNAVAANGGSVEQQIAEVAQVASNFTVGQLGSINPNGTLMAAVSQEILTLADGASLTATQLASAFALAIDNENAVGDTANVGYVVSTLAGIANLTHPSGPESGRSAEPLVAGTIVALTTASGTATASKPLSISEAASFIGGSSDTEVSLLIQVAGQFQSDAFDYAAGAEIASGIDHSGLTAYFPTTLANAVTTSTIGTIDAALLLGAVAAQTTGEQAASQTSDYLTLLAGYATGNSNVVPAFATAVAQDGYDVYTAIQALALIGGAASSLQGQVQGQIVSLIQSGADSVLGDVAVRFLAEMSQLVASSQVTTSLAAQVQTAIAGDIVAIINGNVGVTVTSALTDIGDYVGTTPSVAGDMISLLEYLATYDSNYTGGTVANLEAGGSSAGTLSVQAEIALIVGANEIGLTSAVDSLAALQAANPGTTLATVIGNELDQLATTGVDLVQIAASGSSLTAQELQQQALWISQLGDNLAASGETDGITNPPPASNPTTLHFTSPPSGIADGLFVLDLTNPSAIAGGTTVASYTSTSVTLSADVSGSVSYQDDIAFYKATTDTVATNAATVTTSDALSFTSVPGDVAQGYVVIDLSNPNAIAAETTVQSISGGIVTLSANVAETVNSGDAIAFYQPGIKDVLNAVVANVTNGTNNVTESNAITLLIDLAAIGSVNTSNPALADATRALVTLVADNPSGTAITGIVSDVATAVFNGTLLSGPGLSLLGTLAATGSTAEAAVQGAIEEGLFNGSFTIAQLDAAVTAGTIQPIDAIAALSMAAGVATTAATVTNIGTEIVRLLGAYPGLNGATVLALLTAPVPSSSLLTAAVNYPSAGYAAINAIIAADSSLASGLFSAILGLDSQDQDPNAANELFGSSGLVATGTISVNAALNAIGAYPSAQQLPLLVQLAGISGAQSSVITTVESIVAQAAITPATAIGAFAAADGGASWLTGFYEQMLVDLGENGTGATAFVDALENSEATQSQQLAVLQSLLPNYQVSALDGQSTAQGILNAFTTRINTLVLAEAGSPSGLAAALGQLYAENTYTAAQVMQAAASFYNPLSPEEFLNLIADLPGAGFSETDIASGIVNAVQTDAILAVIGVDLMLVAGTQSTAAMANAAATALGAAIAANKLNSGNDVIAAGLTANIATAVSQNVVTAAQAVTFLTEALLAQPLIQSSVVSDINTLITDAAITKLAAITAMAQGLAPSALNNDLTTDETVQGQIIVLGAAIASLSGSASALQECEAVLAAVGNSTGDLSPDYGIALLAAFAGQGSSATLVAAGEAVAGLVTAGAASASQAGADLYESFSVLAVTTPAQLLNVTIGLLSGGSAPSAAELTADLVAGNQESIATIATTLVGAIGTGPGTVTALQIVDVAALLAADTGLFANPTALVAPVLSSSDLTGAQIVAELGNFIGASPGLTVGNFLSLYAGIEAATGTNSAEQISMGVGLTNLISGGQVSFATAAAALQSDLSGNTLTFGQVLETLLPVGASTSGFAAGETIGGLVENNATDTQTLISDLEAAIPGVLTTTQAMTLLAGVSAGGAQNAAGSAVAALYRAGTFSLTDFENLTNSAIAGATSPAVGVYFLASAFGAASTAAQGTLVQNLAALITQASFTLQFSGAITAGQDEIVGNGSDGVTDALLGDPVSGPGIPSGATVGAVLSGGEIVLAGGVTGTRTTLNGTFTVDDNAAAADAQIVAALPPGSQLAAMAQLLVDLGSAAGAAAVGETLFSIIENGDATDGAIVSALLAAGEIGTSGNYTAAPLFALGSFAQAAATGGQGSIESAVYNTILAAYPGSAGADFVSQHLSALIAAGGASQTIFLPVLAQLVAQDPTDYLTYTGTEFNTLLNNGAITGAELGAAVQATHPTTYAIVTLAAAIDRVNITAQNQLVTAISNLVAGATDFHPYVTDLQESGLPAVQIVGGLAGIAQYALSTGTDGGTAAAIASLIGGVQITQEGAYTVIGQSYQAIGFSGTNLATLIGEVGSALGDTAAQLVSQVAAGSYGGTAATISQLTYLTGIDRQLSGQIQLGAPGLYPLIGVTIGAQITSIVNSRAIGFTQALTDVIQARGVSDNNKALIIVGAAGAATAAQQVAAGAVLGTFLNSGGQPDLVDATVAALSAAQSALLYAGIFETGSAATDATAATLIVNLIQGTGAFAPTQFTNELDGAVTGRALPAATAVEILALVAAAASTSSGAVGIAAIRSAFSAEIVALVNENAATADAAVGTLMASAGAGSTRLQAEVGGLIGALGAASLATASELVTDIASAVTANTLTVTQAIVIDTTAALAGTAALATALGADIGQRIAASQISVTNALAAIASSNSAYAITAGTNEVLLLLAAASANVGGLQLAVGEAIGGLISTGVVGSGATIAAIGGAIGDLSAAQSISVLIGVAQTAGLATQLAIGAEFDSLIGAGTLISSNIIQGLDQALRAGSLSTTPGFAVLPAMASHDGSLTGPITTEIASLVSVSIVTPDQALAALFAAAGATTDAAIAQIVTGLESHTSITAAEASQDLTTASTGGSPTVSTTDAINIFLDVSADGATQTPNQGTVNRLATLLSAGVGATTVTNDLVDEVAARTISAATAVATLIALVASPDATSPAIEIATGGALAALVTNHLLPLETLIGDLQAAVPGTLGVDAVIELMAAMSPTINQPALAAALAGFVQNGTSVTRVFADIEIVAAAGGAGYDAGYGALIAEMAIGANGSVRAAVAAELASLVSRALITTTQAVAYIGDALTNGLSGDAGVLLYASGVAAPLSAGQGIAGIVNAGTIPLTQALGDILALVPGSLSVDGEIELIAVMANDLTASGSLDTLSSALVQLIEAKTATAAQVFGDIATVAQLSGGYSTALGVLLAGMGATSDTILLSQVGTALEGLVTSGALTAATVLADIAAGETAGQLTAAQASALSAGGAALQAAAGAEAGPALVATFVAAQQAGLMTAGQLVGVLTGMGTTTSTPSSGGTAVAAGVINTYALADGTAFMAPSIAGLAILANLSSGEALLRKFASTNTLPLGSDASLYVIFFESALTTLWSSSDQTYLEDYFHTGNPTTIATDLAQALGGFVTNSAQVHFETALANVGIPVADAFDTLNSFIASNALAPAIELTALVANGTISATAAMAAVDAVAPYVSASHLVYFLANLYAAPGLQSAVTQELLNLVHANVLTPSALIADIKAATNATPSNDSLLAAISGQTGFDLVVQLCATAPSATRSALVQAYTASFGVSGTNLSNIPGEISLAVLDSQLTTAEATQILILTAVAGGYPIDDRAAVTLIDTGTAATPTTLDQIAATLFPYIGDNKQTFAADTTLAAQLLADAVNITDQATTSFGAPETAFGAQLTDDAEFAAGLIAAAGGVTSPTVLSRLGWLLGQSIVLTQPGTGPFDAANSPYALTASLGQFVTGITTAEQDGTLTAAQAASMLFGLFPAISFWYAEYYTDITEAGGTPSLVEAAINADAVVAFDTDQAIMNAAVSLVQGNTLSSGGTLTYEAFAADLSAAVSEGSLTSYQQTEILLRLADDDPSVQNAVLSTLTGASVTTSPYLTNASDLALAYADQVAKGAITLDQAIVDIEQQGVINNGDVTAGLQTLATVMAELEPGANDIESLPGYETGVQGAGVSAPLAGVNAADLTDAISQRADYGFAGNDAAVAVYEGAETEQQALSSLVMFGNLAATALSLEVFYADLNGLQNMYVYSPYVSSQVALGVSGFYEILGSLGAGLTGQDLSAADNDKTTGYFNDMSYAADIEYLVGAPASTAIGIVDPQGLVDGYGNPITGIPTTITPAEALGGLTLTTSSTDTVNNTTATYTSSYTVPGVVQELAEDLTGGAAESNIINMVLSGQMSESDAIGSLNQMMAPLLAYESNDPALQTWTQTIAYGWLAVEAWSYIDQDYTISSTVNGFGQTIETVTVPSSPIDTLYDTLIGSPYQTAVSQGLGEIYMLGNATLAINEDVANIVQEDILANDAAALKLPTGSQNVASDFNAIMSNFNAIPGNTPSIATQVTNAAGNAIVSASNAAASAFVNGAEWVWLNAKDTAVKQYDSAETQPGYTWPGVIAGLGEHPTNTQSYVNLLGRFAASGVPGLGNALVSYLKSTTVKEGETTFSEAYEAQFGVPPTGIDTAQGSIDDYVAGAAGDGASSYLLALSIDAKIDVYLLSLGGAQQVLGPVDPALLGIFSLISSMCDLFGNLPTALAQTALTQWEGGFQALGTAFYDLSTNNFSDAQTQTVNGLEALLPVFTAGATTATAQAIASLGEDGYHTIVDLFEGNVTDFAAAAQELGPLVWNVIQTNVFFQAAESVLSSFGSTAWADLEESGAAIASIFGENDNPEYGPPPPPVTVPSVTLPNGAPVELATPDYQGDQLYEPPGSNYYGTATDGYIANATVTVEFDGATAYTTTTDAAGNYALPEGISGTIVITGGTDIATGLPFTGTFTAPAGSTSVTALTTLIETIAQSNGGNIATATQQVDTALGLPNSAAPTQTNPILATQSGSTNGAQLFTATSEVQNTLALLDAAGGTSSVAALANAITNLSSGSTLDLTDPTTIANIATAAGVDSMTAAATGMLASASNGAVQQQAANSTSGQDLLTNVTAVGIVTQGRTATQLSQSVGNSGALNNTVGSFTGNNLDTQVTSSTSQVGNLSAVSLNPANGELGVGATVEITVNLVDPVLVDTTGGTPTLTLNDNEVATYDPGKSTAAALVFDYTVQPGDSTPALGTAAAGISLNGAVITDLVTNAPANLSGAQSATPAGVLVIDTTPPPIPSAPVLAASSEVGSDANLANSADATFTGTAVAGTTVALYAGNFVVGTATAGSSRYSITISNPPPGGTYTFTATATDAAGNVSAASAGTVVTVPGPPVITGTEPDQPAILDAPVAPFADVAITDPNAGATDTLTVTVAGAGGTLAGPGLGGGAGGVYTLSGTAGAVTSELDALVFTPAPTPSETASTTTFTVSDQSSGFPGTVPDAGTSVIDYGVGTIVSISPSIASGTLGLGASLMIALTMSSPVKVTGTPTLSLNDNGTATYDAAASTSTLLVFDYTVTAGQINPLAVTGVNLPGGAAITDGLGHSADLTLPPDATFGGVQVEAVVAGNLAGDGFTDPLMVSQNTGAVVLDELGGNSALGYTAIGAVGPEWRFEGDGTFLGDGKDGFLIWANDPTQPDYGALVVGEDAGGTATYTLIGGIGPEWQFEGNGPLLGNSTDDFLLWDGSSSSASYGTLVVGSVSEGQAQYAAIGGVGPEWQFEGMGDYLGDGNTGFLMENQNNGNLIVGEVVNSSAQYTLVGNLSSAWEFEGSGDLLGQGRDDFLVWDKSSSDPNYGALSVGQVAGGTVQYVGIGGVGPEWQILGVGDYDGKTPSEFLMRDSNNGELVLGTVNSNNGAYGTTYAQVGNVGSEWNFHTNNVATVV
jgi:hypothetical protein